jgi:hypothetical protein
MLIMQIIILFTNAVKDLVDAATTLLICVGFYSWNGSGKKRHLIHQLTGQICLKEQ